MGKSGLGFRGGVGFTVRQVLTQLALGRTVHGGQVQLGLGFNLF